MIASRERSLTSAYPDLDGAKILLVDDDPAIHEVVEAIAEEAGSTLVSAMTSAEATCIITQESFDIALIDMVLPDANGIELITHVGTHAPDVSIIVITGHADHEMAYSLENAGVRSVLTKPFSPTQLRFSLCKEIARRRLLEREGAIGPLAANGDEAGLVGNSTYMENLRRTINLFAQGNIPVLIEGPTGTGKEIIAAAIHRLSSRANSPMMVVNSSAIPEHLEEAEFFGHARGAFTGAHEEKAGIIQCADNSSLFLDEVGDLSLRMQAKLLRVLDGHGYTRVGDPTPRQSDFRLISATNRPLTEMIAEGLFREDLYFRLKSGCIRTMPLCSHREDIPLLIRHFLFETGARCKRDYVITADAIDALSGYSWPGNIRELRNVVETLCTINTKNRTITSESIEWVIPGICRSRSTPPAPFSEAKTGFEKSFYTALLAKHNGNITASAAEAGIDRPNFSKKCKTLGIRALDYKKTRQPKKEAPGAAT